MYYLYPEDMKKENSAQEPNPNFVIKKFEEGIDFYASGNEPFWNLDMDFEKGIRFTTIDGLVYNSPAQKNLIKQRIPILPGTEQ
ncbi:MAG: hypothetical protein U5K51_14555 [Flavobacteriaceae bacterium]|nr:hypothetical protein [Flavobacteriaceae bacterium]